MDPKLILNTIEGKIDNYNLNKVVDNYKAKDISNPVTIATRDIVKEMANQYQNMLDRTLNGKSNSTGGVGPSYELKAKEIYMGSGFQVEKARASYVIEQKPYNR